MTFKREIKRDLLGIAREVKKIDRDYRIFFDEKTLRFEVHNLRYKNRTLQCVLPFDRLDMRALRYVRDTHIANIAETLKKIEQENAEAEKRKERKRLDKALAKLDGII